MSYLDESFNKNILKSVCESSFSVTENKLMLCKNKSPITYLLR